jgi:oxygen-independent coproporphyrinogen-3 oxidase
MDNYIDEYINALCFEILQNSEILSQYNISSIYFGGGTPSYIESKYIVQIMDTLKMFLDDEKLNDIEVTIEVNPNSANYDKLVSYKECGINRVSIGLQSTNDLVLKNIGRKHKFEDFLNTLSNCKKAKISNISVDLIYPLPYLTKDILKDSVEKIASLSDEFNIQHVSIYNLEVHENTKLDFLLKEGFVSLVDEDEEYEMKQILENTLEKNGFFKYEISNFAKEGFESKHNMNYWKQGEYLGFGVAASSFFGGTRYTNTKEINKYISSINNGNNILIEKESLDKLDLMKEYVILNLRLKDGVNLAKFKKKFDEDLMKLFGTEVKDLEINALITKTSENIFLNKRGTEVANIVWEKFI